MNPILSFLFRPKIKSLLRGLIMIYHFRIIWYVLGNRNMLRNHVGNKALLLGSFIFWNKHMNKIMGFSFLWLKMTLFWIRSILERWKCPDRTWSPRVLLGPMFFEPSLISAKQNCFYSKLSFWIKKKLSLTWIDFQR